MKHNEIWVSSVKPSKWTEDAINRAKDILDRRNRPIDFTSCYLGKQETFEEGRTRCNHAKTIYSARYEAEITTCKIQEAPMALCSEESCPYFHKGDAYIIIEKRGKKNNST